MADIVAADAEWREWLDSDQLGAITDGTAPAMAASSSSCIKEEQAEDKTKSAQALVKLQEAYDTTTRLNKDFSIRDYFFLKFRLKVRWKYCNAHGNVNGNFDVILNFPWKCHGKFMELLMDNAL